MRKKNSNWYFKGKKEQLNSAIFPPNIERQMQNQTLVSTLEDFIYCKIYITKWTFRAIMSRLFSKVIRIYTENLVYITMKVNNVENATTFLFSDNLIWQFLKIIPGLTAMVKHDDHAMTWHHHGDSYSPLLIMLRSCHGHHEIQHDHGMAVMENIMIMPWWPWSLL